MVWIIFIFFWSNSTVSAGNRFIVNRKIAKNVEEHSLKMVTKISNFPLTYLVFKKTFDPENILNQTL